MQIVPTQTKTKIDNVQSSNTDELVYIICFAENTNHLNDFVSEKLKKAPEYSILEGTFEIQVLITEQPTLIN